MGRRIPSDFVETTMTAIRLGAFSSTLPAVPAALSRTLRLLSRRLRRTVAGPIALSSLNDRLLNDIGLYSHETSVNGHKPSRAMRTA